MVKTNCSGLMDCVTVVVLIQQFLESFDSCFIMFSDIISSIQPPGRQMTSVPIFSPRACRTPHPPWQKEGGGVGGQSWWRDNWRKHHKGFNWSLFFSSFFHFAVRLHIMSYSYCSQNTNINHISNCKSLLWSKQRESCQFRFFEILASLLNYIKRP